MATKSLLAAGAADRMRRIMFVLAAIGAAAFALTKGISWGAGFATGAMLSIASFHYTNRFVLRLGDSAAARPGTFKIVLAGSRYLIIGVFVYAMMSLFGVGVISILCGLMIAGAAAILEILYELFHGT